jgi:hypothetical protein
MYSKNKKDKLCVNLSFHPILSLLIIISVVTFALDYLTSAPGSMCVLIIDITKCLLQLSSELKACRGNDLICLLVCHNFFESSVIMFHFVTITANCFVIYILACSFSLSSEYRC